MTESADKTELAAPTRAPMAPIEVIAQSELAQKLKELGATDADLARLLFLKFDADLPFTAWNITGPEWLVLHHCGLSKAYCAFRWLILDDPPSSRNKDDAWAYISQILAGPIYQLGLEARENQRKRAAHPRVAKGDRGDTLHQIIQALISKPEYRDLRAKQLWPHFRSALEENGLGPKEEAAAGGDPRKSTYSYDFREGRRYISFGSFSNLVSKLRKKSR